MLRDRLPTKFNLLRRGIIHGENSSCVAGCGCIESAQHFLFLVIFSASCGIMFDSGSVFQVLITTT